MSKCGYVTIIGKTNVGKSTFLNKFLEKKVSITANKSQTTRSNIYAIKSLKTTQIIFIDTPGIHKKSEKTINKVLRKKPAEVIHDVDVIIFMVSGTKFDAIDKESLDLANESHAKKILVINKIDLVKNKKELFSFVEKTFNKDDFYSIIPISAKNNDGIDLVQQELEKALPENEFFYPEEIDFQSNTFEISEIIREKVIRLLGDELPYETAVVIELLNEKKDVFEIDANIYVSKQSQKSIVIGKSGEKIKSIGTAARIDLERKLNKKVMLKLWCKVQKNWVNNPISLESFGIKS
ncbi:MAG: GTPase Era [Pseudomonadota bacterium]|jgi:GTP-binding protein Era|nr:GTPase Era [Pseudomonadota bacterium]|tara:strand:- start:1366 stop:2247 length:882 start_codon:yes stop_codon:yes gene_type:complete